MEIRRRNLHIETKKIKQKDKQRQGDYLHENSEKLDTPLPNRKMSTPGRNNRLLQDRSKVYNLYGSIDKNSIKNASTSKIKNSKQMKLPLILKLHSMDSTESHLIKQTRNPEQGKQFVKQGKIIYYQHRLLEYFKSSDMNYHSNLHRKHFVESIEAIRIGRYIKTPPPFKTLELPKKNHHVKTIYLDLDETLIHCEQKPSKYSVKLNFPVQRGTITAGIRIRPHCQDFLRKLSQIAQIVIFTASSSSYADVVLNHLDPQKKYISHRLYRQHCTPSKGFFLKDLRIVTNRSLENVLLVDNLSCSFLLQLHNGIPIVPFYHNANDEELLDLLEFLKHAVQHQDIREPVKQRFFWTKYLKDNKHPKSIFMQEMSQKQV